MESAANRRSHASWLTSTALLIRQTRNTAGCRTPVLEPVRAALFSQLSLAQHESPRQPNWRGFWRSVFVQRMLQDVTEHDREIDLALRDAVAGKVGQERFDLWFGDSVALRLTGGSLLVSAGDQFTLDRLQSQFRRELISAGETIAQGPVVLQFRLDATHRESRLGRVGCHPTDPPAADDPVQRSAVHPTSNVPSTLRTTAKQAPPRRRRFAHLSQFVVGEGSRLAHTAAQMVVERPGTVSPLFLFGPSGSGKTHLLEGIWSAVRGGRHNRRVLYLTAEQFTSMFLEALRGSGLPSFRYKYRHVDLLLLDDVQFFPGQTSDTR